MGSLKSLIFPTVLLLLLQALPTRTQTIQIGSQPVAANKSTVAPAAATVSQNASLSGIPYFTYEATQLTPAVLANLTTLGLTDISLFDFNVSSQPRPLCKAFPETPDWPSEVSWKVLDLLLGGALAKTIPLAAPCFDTWPSVRDEVQCAQINASWKTPRFHIDDLASVIEPLYEGGTCLPRNSPNGSCTVGGFPAYVVNVTNVAQVQLAVNMARNANLRLVIKNKGHDFNGKSTGAGGLSVYTNHLRDVRFIPEYSNGRYKGPAFKLGAGVEVETMYQEAEKRGLSVVGGIGRTVGLAGGYSAGGGHSPISSVYGLGSDQIISLEVVLPDGRFVTANEEHNKDLFWALRGGGGSTFGVVTSAIIATYPRLPAATVTYSITTSDPAVSVSTGAFWDGIRAFFETFVANADAGHYVYFRFVCQTPVQPDNCTLTLQPHWGNNMTAAQLQFWMAPFFSKLSKLGIPVVNPVFKQYPSVLEAFEGTFPISGESAGGTTIHVASRLFPRENFQVSNATLFNATFDAIRTTMRTNGRMLAYNIKAGVNPALDQENAVTPAWRKTVLFAMMSNPWTEGASIETMVNKSQDLINKMQVWRDVTPGAGSYLNEGDINEPNFQQAFYGQNYPRVYELKQKYDPTGTLYAVTAVGSEDWYVADQIPLYPTSDGRLCRKSKWQEGFSKLQV